MKQELLRHLNITPGQKVEYKLPDGRIVVGLASPKHSIAEFSGILAKRDTPKLTIAQIKKITEDAWAGKR